MKKIPFKTTIIRDGLNVMSMGDINPDEITFNPVTREISIAYEPIEYLTYTREDIDQMSWQNIKRLVVENTGEWTNKADGIEFLIGREK